MRKIINSTYISLDGVVERLHELQPSVGPRGDKGDEIQTELLLGCDALIMGRRTYEGFAPVWPTRSGDPASDHINSMSKYVVSSTLTDPEWTNTSVIGGDPVEELKRLKEAPGKDIVQYGFGQLSHTLMEQGAAARNLRALRRPRPADARGDGPDARRRLDPALRPGRRARR